MSEERILIAGAGPVGTIAGYCLARAGVPVTLFDSLAEIPTDHRAATLQPSTLDLLDEFGMTGALLEKGIRSPWIQYRDRADDRIVAEFDLGRLADDTNHPFALQVEQHKTIGVALALARALPDFTLHRRHTVTAVEQNADHVEITVADEDGGTRRHRGRYLIGCEGGGSISRKEAGIDFPGFTWNERFIIVGTPYDFGDHGYRYRNYIAHPEQWCAMMKVPGDDFSGVWRCLFPAMGDEPDEVVTGDEWIQARFRECLPYDPPYEIVHRNLYPVHQRVATAFRKGRVVLAGDSAHVNNPIGGMGMNSGIHDALNLAGKLIRIWRGEAGEELLDQYDRQRRPTATKYVQAQSIQNKKILEENDPAARRKRLDDLAATAADPKRAREFMLRTSLIAMVREADSIQ